MTDFRKLAAEAKAKHAAEVQAKTDAAAARKAESEGFVARGTAALDRAVVPLLDQAIVAFGEEGIGAYYTRNYDVVGQYTYYERDRSRPVWPSLRFQCRTVPKEPGSRQREAPPVFFSSDGTVLVIGAADNGFSLSATTTMKTVPVEQANDAVAMAIEKALASYFAKIKP